jgi:hypothetical protein
MAPSRRCGLPRRKIPHQIGPVEEQNADAGRRRAPGTAAMILASTPGKPTGNRSSLTGRFLSSASAAPSSVAGSSAMRLENMRNPAVGDDPGHNPRLCKGHQPSAPEPATTSVAHQLRSHSRLSGRRPGASRCARRSPPVIADPSPTALLAGCPGKHAGVSPSNSKSRQVRVLN